MPFKPTICLGKTLYLVIPGCRITAITLSEARMLRSKGFAQATRWATGYLNQYN